jgi:DNA-binding NarL/FixJ family response regulator
MPKCILIVDDSPAIRRALREALEQEPALRICGEAVDGQDAIEKAQRVEPDLVVLDLSMPIMNGLQAARELKRIFPSIPLLMFTSFDSKQLKREALEAGISDVVSKSQPLQNLLGSIHTLLEPAS